MTTKTKPVTETEALFRDLDKPSLHALSYALRHPDTWPEGFVWDYNDCQQCAMGLAHRLWAQIPSVDWDDDESGWRAEVSTMARSFAIPFGEAERIFMDTHAQYTRSTMFGFCQTHIGRRSVTPEMVADQIDAYLARVTK